MKKTAEWPRTIFTKRYGEVESLGAIAVLEREGDYRSGFIRLRFMQTLGQPHWDLTTEAATNLRDALTRFLEDKEIDR